MPFSSGYKGTCDAIKRVSRGKICMHYNEGLFEYCCLISVNI